ncbi:hypothetical protein [Lederbergia panacisoli]|uniref:hypothetical protein n=1 Tax=Lederbergia panacisoli TaxID=1255251 RepID=UPI00214BB36D|nr:hypothetical protein [Lederbergia panacisoli]MCR2823765.1 hypothetical protein [Lederbergia panacisoli]
MRLDDKKKKIQLDYREKMQRKKDNKKHTLEAIIIAAIIFAFIMLNTFSKSF